MNPHTKFKSHIIIIATINIYIVGASANISESFDAYREDSVKRSVQSQDYDPAPNEGKVILEPLNVQKEEKEGRYKLIPYNQRRKKWGSSIQAGYSFFKPENYIPDFSAFDFVDVYGDENQPIIEIQYVYKRNFNLIAVGVELSYGNYSVTSLDGASELNLNPARIGFVFDLDGFMNEPRVVPYVSFGGYVMMYKEKQGTSLLDANTSVAPYYSAGIKMQLNWMDTEASRTAYEDSGIENTFLFVDVRQFMASSVEQDKIFETEPFMTAGLNIEY